MKLNNNPINLPDDIDDDCREICCILNSLPGVMTFESCSGHGKDIFNVWFKCDNIETLSRLARAVNKNYSDGNWEIVADSTDTDPYGIFWLRSKEIITDKQTLYDLCQNIVYWFDDMFDNYFKSH